MTTHDTTKVLVCTTIAMWAALVSGCVELDPATSQQSSQIIDNQPTFAGQLEGVAFIRTPRPAGGFLLCTGSLITNDTVLTAAHCVCDGGACSARSLVKFRDPMSGNLDAHNAEVDDPLLNHEGNVFHLGTTYNTITDIAIIKLDTPAPWFVQPFTTARKNPPEGSPVIIAGYGDFGPDCGASADQDAPDLFYTPRGKHIDDYNGDGMVRYYDELACEGDSGGPHLLDTGGISASFQIVGLTSGYEWTLPHGTVDLATPVGFNDAWIKKLVCTSSSQNLCSAPPGTDICDCSSSTSLIWKNTNKQVALWTLDGNIFTDTYPGTLPGTFQIYGAGDFDGDGHRDLLLRDASGQVQIWRMNGSGSVISMFNVGGTDPTHQWAIQTVADFDGDGHSDILWRHTSGQLAIWHSGNINTATFPSYQNARGPVDNHWVVLGAADLDGDGKADILWRNGNALAIWLMNGGLFVADEYPADIAAGSVFQGLGDFNGDGKADVLWRMQNGMLKISFGGFGVAPGPSYQNATTGSLPSPASTAYEIIGIGDVDHDGRDDLIWRDVSHKGWISIWLLDGVRFIGDYQARGPQDTAPRYVDTSWTSFRTLRELGF